MLTDKEIADILELYKKHGWTLSRVLLSPETENALPADRREKLFGAVEIVPSQIDAAWFTRPSKKDSAAWELRHLNAAPFALFEVFAAGTGEDVRRAKLQEMENRLIEKFAKK
jgi:hypothetical protein